MSSDINFNELRFFAEVKKRPGMFFGKPSLLSLRDNIFGMSHAFEICGYDNQFKFFCLFTDWYFENVIENQNGYACWWNHILYVSGNDDVYAFHTFFNLFEKYLKDMHNLSLPEIEYKPDAYIEEYL